MTIEGGHMADEAFKTLEKWGRTSPYGILRFAHQYLVAAQILHKQMVTPGISMPKYTNIGLSTELALKAFLLAKGVTLQTLRNRPYGHDLQRLYEACVERCIRDYVDVSEFYRTTITTLSEPYKAQVLRYIVNGTMVLPEWEWLDLTASMLTDGLRQFCLAATMGEEEAKRTIAVRGNRW